MSFFSDDWEPRELGGTPAEAPVWSGDATPPSAGPGLTAMGVGWQPRLTSAWRVPCSYCCAVAASGAGLCRPGHCAPCVSPRPPPQAGTLTSGPPPEAPTLLVTRAVCRMQHQSSAPSQSFLGCVLQNWVIFSDAPTYRKKMLFYCNVAFSKIPWDPGRNGPKWLSK